MLRPFRYRLRTLLLGGPIVAILAAWGMSRPVVEVHAWIVLDERRLAQDGQAPAQPLDSSHPAQPSHMTAIKSRAVVSRALAAPGIAGLPVVQHQSDPTTWLRDRLQVEVRDDSRLVRISLRGREPDQLARVLHAVAAAYSGTARE